MPTAMNDNRCEAKNILDSNLEGKNEIEMANDPEFKLRVSRISRTSETLSLAETF